MSAGASSPTDVTSVRSSRAEEPPAILSGIHILVTESQVSDWLLVGDGAVTSARSLSTVPCGTTVTVPLRLPPLVPALRGPSTSSEKLATSLGSWSLCPYSTLLNLQTQVLPRLLMLLSRFLMSVSASAPGPASVDVPMNSSTTSASAPKLLRRIVNP